jgi:hypothetical protein
MRLVHFGEQADVGIGITAGELMAPVNPSLNSAAFAVPPPGASFCALY